MFISIIEDKINKLKTEKEYEINGRTKEMIDYTITVLEELLSVYRQQDIIEENNHIYM